MAPPKKKVAAPTAQELIVAATLTQEESDAAEEANREPVEAAPTVSPDVLTEVWERRFNNPGMESGKSIRLKMPGMTLRWINTAIEGRHHQAVYDQGWQPVPVNVLADPASIPDLYKHPHGIVCRGERGKEVLMMMPETVYRKIQLRKAELNHRALKNIRNEVAGAAASKFGGDAGEFIAGGGTADGNIKTVGSINFGTERVPMGGE